MQNSKPKTQSYNPSLIESKWQDVWEKEGVYKPDLDKSSTFFLQGIEPTQKNKPPNLQSLLRGFKKVLDKPFNKAQGHGPFYNLMMFPYPSAEGMHVGNMYAFTGADVYGRFQRMRGNDVFEPIGLDGFGIHSENYAIKVGRHPVEQAKISEKNFYRQLKSIGNSFDWTRTVETYKPEYYKWTQWLFIQLFKAGLAYRKKAPVNFCPSCKTVLADEQVITKLKVESGKLKVGEDPRSDPRSSTQESLKETTVNVCERCESEVVKKELEQWFFRITKYADRLLTNIAKLDWSEKVKIAQRQWIGRSEGTLIKFKIKDLRLKNKEIEVFTSRADTLYGATFLVLAPEHPFLGQILKQVQDDKIRKQIEAYVEEAKEKTEQERMAEKKEKTGVFSGLYAINPLNNEQLPIWIADYAVIGYGTGALFGDAHDQRDVEFAKKYNISLKPTIITGDKYKDKRIRNLEECFTGYGVLFDSGKFNGLTSKEAIARITSWLEKKNMGGKEATYHLRDWLISRQRYWGPPIPMIYCQSCAKKGDSGFTLTKKSAFADGLASQTGLLNDRLDNLESNITQKSGFVKGMDLPGVEPGRHGLSSRSSKPAEPMPESAYKKNNEFVNDWNSSGWFTVPEDQLPVLLPDVKDWKPKGTGKSPLASVESFVNTKCPNCGKGAKREADVSDTFLDSSWYFLRYLAAEFDDIPFPMKKEMLKPASPKLPLRPRSEASQRGERVQHDIVGRTKWLPVTMYIGGAEHSVLHLLYSRFITMVLKDMGFISFEEPFAKFRAHGLLVKDSAKMSKSRGNVVIPDQYIKKFGADTLRAYLMFMGPFSQGGDFRDSGIEGMHRFLRRVWALAQSHLKSSSGSEMLKRVQHDNEIKQMMHKTIKKVTEDISSLSYNTAIAALMEYYNFLSDQKSVNWEEIKTFLKLIAPFAPHVSEELYQLLKVSKEKKVSKVPNGEGIFFESIHIQPWPTYDPKFLVKDELVIVVQVNGKLRGSLVVDLATSKNRAKIEELARKDSNVVKHLEAKDTKKVIFVEGKVINFVVNS